MAIKEKITQEDLKLYEILRNPVLFSEFVHNLDKLPSEQKISLTSYQKDILGDSNHYISICAGRAVGKTFSLVSMIIYLLVNKIYNNYIVYTVPNKAQLDPVWHGLVRMFRTNSFLRNFLDPARGINGSEHSIKLKNGSILLCRIAGQSGTGANVVGLHTPLVILDEAGFYNWGTWLELQPILNTWEKDFKLIVSGVPTGLREKNVLYHTDKENTHYSRHRISAFDNPRFSEADLKRAIEQYGGKDSEDFKHFVLGEHGSPTFSVFDRRLFTIESYPVYKLVINGTELGFDVSMYLEKINALPEVPSDAENIFIGIDPGYNDPTAVSIFYISKKDSKIRFHARLKLNKVSYSVQDKFISYLDDKFHPSFIAIDDGHAGKALTQVLLDPHSFPHKKLYDRIIPVNFASKVNIGTDHEGKDISSKLKPLSVSILQDYSNTGKLVYSSTDVDMILELERMVYTKNSFGDIVYYVASSGGGKNGEDHFTSALLCGIFGYYKRTSLNIFETRKIKKLITPRWYM